MKGKFVVVVVLLFFLPVLKRVPTWERWRSQMTKSYLHTNTQILCWYNGRLHCDGNNLGAVEGFYLIYRGAAYLSTPQDNARQNVFVLKFNLKWKSLRFIEFYIFVWIWLSSWRDRRRFRGTPIRLWFVLIAVKTSFVMRLERFVWFLKVMEYEFINEVLGSEIN